MDAFEEIVDEIASGSPEPISMTRSRQQRGAVFQAKPISLSPLALIPDKPKRARQTHIATHDMDASAGDDGGQLGSGARELAAPVIAKPKRARRVRHDTQIKAASAGDDECLPKFETQVEDASVIAEIAQLWRMRQRWHRAGKSLILQGKAICRAWTEGDKEKASDLFDACRAAASDAAKSVEAVPPPDLIIALSPYIAAISEFAPLRAGIEKSLRKMARSLPVWPWVSQARGFGDLNLAAIVGEAWSPNALGSVGSYRSVSALWKRMGLAVIDGVRQRKMTNADDALAHGYSPQRRSVAFNLGDCLVKGNGDGPYRQLYLARKKVEEAKPDMRPIIAHRRAARYMTKAVLRDLYLEWRRAEK